LCIFGLAGISKVAAVGLSGDEAGGSVEGAILGVLRQRETRGGVGSLKLFSYVDVDHESAHQPGMPSHDLRFISPFSICPTKYLYILMLLTD
jgi:hypothetical protein